MPRRPCTEAQQDFGFRTPPRKRKRKRGRPKKPGACVPHLPREVHRRHPLHVTLRMQRHVYQLRSRRCYRVMYKAFRSSTARANARVVEFSIQYNHVHLLVEADEARALARAVQGLSIRIAKGLNKLMNRRGSVFADRYHSRSLRTPTEVRRALVYVLCNGRKHLPRGQALSPAWVDTYSSGPWFKGWTVRFEAPEATSPVQRPATWLLKVGWLERGGGGPIGPDEMPREPP